MAFPLAAFFANMKLSEISLAALFIMAQLPVSAQSLERVFTKGDRLIYLGYEITRSAKPGADSWTITIGHPGTASRMFNLRLHLPSK
jgi:hypothetical protein